MKTYKLNRGDEAITLLEVLVIVAVLVAVAGLLMPAGNHGRSKALRINCASNLKQIGLAFRIWEGDNGGRYPMSFYTNEMGGPLFATATNAYRYFQVMSNELNNPKLLHCPADLERNIATNFNGDFNSSRIGYFIGLQADEKYPQSFLAGDSNLTNGTTLKNGIMEITTNQVVGWTKERHNYAGNVGLADGSVQQFSTSALQRALQNTGLATNRLLFP